jgi:hypothetical protein
MAIGTSEPPRIDYKAPSKGGEQVRPDTRNPESTGPGSGQTYGALNHKHMEYDAGYWRVCRALYAGGREMFKDKKLIKSIFPQHRNEAPDIYEERLKRAFYIPYPGEIIDYILSSLMGSPVEMTAEADPDEYYDEFFKDTSPQGGKRCTLNQLLRQQILTALLCRRAWTQVDFPLGNEEVISQADQERAGTTEAYAIAHDPEHIFDWEEDGTGELLWAKVCMITNRRPHAFASTRLITRTYTIYTREGWSRYEITYDYEKPPEEKTIVPLIGEGLHSFGKVPLLRLELPESLWVMNKLSGLALEFFNKRCALSWAEYKSLFQERYEFEAPPDPIAGGPSIAEDEDRALNQIHGIGYTQLRYAGDRVEYVGPDSAPFKVALESLKDLRDEMHRVTHQMALTFDNGPAALGRSADSKAADKAANGVVLTGLGEYVRDHAFDVTQTISDGRQDDLEWSASGMDKFETQGFSSMVEDAEKLENINIPSPTFHKLHKYELAKVGLGDEASDEDLDKIESELEEAFNQETLMEPPMVSDELVEMAESELETVGGDDIRPADRQEPRRGFNSRPQPTS